MLCRNGEVPLPKIFFQNLHKKLDKLLFMHIIHDPYWFLKSLFRGSHITRRYYRHFRIYYFTHDIYETDSLVLE